MLFQVFYEDFQSLRTAKCDKLVYGPSSLMDKLLSVAGGDRPTDLIHGVFTPFNRQCFSFECIGGWPLIRLVVGVMLPYHCCVSTASMEDVKIPTFV